MADRSSKNREKNGIRRFTTNSLYLWLRIAGTILATILTTRFLLVALGVEAFGVYAAVISVGLSFGFLTAALQASTLRAIAMMHKDDMQMTRLFNALIGLHFFIALILIILGLTLGAWMIDSIMVIPSNLLPSAHSALVLVVIASAGTTFLSPYEALLQARDRFGVYSMLDVLRAWALIPVALILDNYSGDRLLAYALASVLASLGVFVVGAVIVMHQYPLTRPRLRYFISIPVYRTQISLFSWTLLGSLAAVARHQGVPVIVNVVGGPIASAALSIANQVQGALRQMSTAIGAVLTPRIYRQQSFGGVEQMLGVALTACRLSALVVVGFGFPLVSEASTILRLWLGPGAPDAVQLITLLCAILLVDQTSAALGSAHMALGRIARNQLVGAILMIGFLPVGYLAGRSTGEPEAVIWVLLGFVLLNAVARALLLERGVPGATNRWILETVWPIMICSITVAFVIALAGRVLPPSPFFMVATILVAGIAFLAVAFSFGLQPVERALLRAMVGGPK